MDMVLTGPARGVRSRGLLEGSFMELVLQTMKTNPQITPILTQEDLSA
ncbi:MAG TPA: hypothetical protein VNM72_05615 [Blastocatellia bacterium]|nr:hypothetical protein [Blastocatellia bacterium]